MPDHVRSRSERRPVRRPCQSKGEFANVAASTGPRSWARCQRVVELRDRAGVEVHLGRGRVAHHRATGGPPCVEVALHRAVAGEVDHSVAWSGGVEADAAELDAVGRERLSRRGGVALHARDGARDAELGGAAQLELAAGLEGQEAARGEGIGEV